MHQADVLPDVLRVINTVSEARALEYATQFVGNMALLVNLRDLQDFSESKLRQLADDLDPELGIVAQNAKLAQYRLEELHPRKEETVEQNPQWVYFSYPERKDSVR